MNSFTVLWEAALKKLDTYFYLNNNGTAFNTYIKTLSPQFEEMADMSSGCPMCTTRSWPAGLSGRFRMP